MGSELLVVRTAQDRNMYHISGTSADRIEIYSTSDVDQNDRKKKYRSFCNHRSAIRDRGLLRRSKRYGDKQEEANARLGSRTAHEKEDKAYEQSMELLLLPRIV